MSKLSALYDLLRSDGSIIINKSLSFAIGVNENIIFNELISRQNYFEAQGKLTPDGFFFNRIYDLYAATCMTEKQQRAAIHNLVGLKLIRCENRANNLRHFQIIDDEPLLLQYIADGKKILENIIIDGERLTKEKTAKNKLRKANLLDSSILSESELQEIEAKKQADSDLLAESILTKNRNKHLRKFGIVEENKAESDPTKEQLNNTKPTIPTNTTNNNTREENTNQSNSTPITNPIDNPESISEKQEEAQELSPMEKLYNYAKETIGIEIAANTWFKGLEIPSINPERVEVLTVNQFTQGIVEARYKDLIQKFLFEEYHIKPIVIIKAKVA